MTKDNKRHILVTLTALLLGMFIVVQWRSFGTLSEANRDVQKNVFREIQILKETNQNLKTEIAGLSDTLEETSSNAQVLKSIEEEIGKYELLAGEIDVNGPGVTIQINTNIDLIWVVDLVNELWNGGAEAISINGIRLSDKTQGFELLPQGQVFLHVNTLELPYSFQAIGEPSVLEKVLLQESGIFDRMKEKYPDLSFEVTNQERLEIEGI